MRVPSDSSLHLPEDLGIPEAADLLDPSRVLDVLQPSFGVTRLSDARIRYLEYDPGRSILVALDVWADTTRQEVVVSRGRLRVEPAQAVAGPSGRVGGPDWPMAEWGEVPLVVAWYPCDPGLPLLADPDLFASALGLAGGPVRRLAWVPQQRAVLRGSGWVAKLHHTPAGAARTVASMRAVGAWLPTAELMCVDLAAGVVVQTAVAGRALLRADALDAAVEAARLLRRLHDSPLKALDPRGSDHVLDLCRPVVRLMRFACPSLRARIDQLFARMVDVAPLDETLVPSHGDFNMGQLLRHDDGSLAVVDTETLCRAPAALDLACYAANLVSGRDGDLEAARITVVALVEGYGESPADLDWYLAVCVLRRLDRALRRAKRHWVSRTEELLACAEALVPG